MSDIKPNSPKPEHGLHFTTPSATWDEALPLGNGIMGALVWGDGHPLKISLDRTDLWDTREVPEFHSPECSFTQMRKWHGEGKVDDLLRVYEQPYHRPGPTKLPGGRIEIDMPDGVDFVSADLDIASAIVTIRFTNDTTARMLVLAEYPIGMISVHGKAPVSVRLISPFGGNGGLDAATIKEMCYRPPLETSGETWRSYAQEGHGGFNWAADVRWREKGGEWLGVWSMTSNSQWQHKTLTAKAGIDPLPVAKLYNTNLLKVGFAVKGHEEWWRNYWRQSSVTLPNKAIEREWYLEQYKFGSASRRGCPPITLQGPWTADGGLPPWKGDYHHDMNTELSYSPQYSANHLEEGLSFQDWLWSTRRMCFEYTKRFYGMPGFNVPMTADIRNSQIGGWRQYAFSSTIAAWLAHSFYQHWQYSRDRKFLKDRAYPYLRDASVFIEAITAEKGADGKRTLPLSASPEIHDNRPEAWFPTITNYDLALVRWLLGATAELAGELKLKKEADHWRAVLVEMPDYTYAVDGALLIAKDAPMAESHRHFSHMLAVFPLEVIRWDDGPAAQKTMLASLAQLDKLGTEHWCGYSFPWYAAIAALARDGNRAEKALNTFIEAFVLRNSFHCNGDQSDKGYSNFTYRPFTLEGNFVFATAVQDMLLQSRGGNIHIFPALPDGWKDVSFTTLRAEGAFLVSAEMTGGTTKRVEITAEQGGACTLVSPFSGKDIVLKIGKGEHITLTEDPK